MARGRNGQPLLNPMFSEGLMGLPQGWTGLSVPLGSTSQATPWSHWWQHMRSALCGLLLLELNYLRHVSNNSTSAEVANGHNT